MRPQRVFLCAWLPDSRTEGRRRLLLLGTDFSEATGHSSGMTTGSQRFIVHLARVIVLSDHPDPTLKRSALDLPPSGPKLISQGLHCRSIWSQELLLPWVLKAFEVTLWCSLDSDSCQHILLPPFLSSSEILHPQSPGVHTQGGTCMCVVVSSAIFGSIAWHPSCLGDIVQTNACIRWMAPCWARDTTDRCPTLGDKRNLSPTWYFISVTL